MAVLNPYPRTCRPFLNGDYFGSWAYLTDARYANDPQHYIRAALILETDVKTLFEYVEPADEHLKCYSYRIHGLLLRTCVEIEANCKAILSENGYPKEKTYFTDYQKVEQSHFLSQYEVKLPSWRGSKGTRRPFNEWMNGQRPTWYSAYNESKHNRQAGFAMANLENLTDAISALVVILAAQFLNHDFIPEFALGGMMGPGDGFQGTHGGYFRIRYPSNLPVSQRYDFDWNAIKNQADPFVKFPYQ